MRSTSIVAGMLPVLVAGVCQAQQAPRRPRLAENADTNAARAYYQHGVQVLATRPQEAAAAFYWATRLEPVSPEPWYAQRVALLLSNEARLWGYMSANRQVITSPEVQRIDSLHLRSLRIDPLFFQHLNGELYLQYLTRRISTELRNAGVSVRDRNALVLALEDLSHRYYPADAGYLAYAKGQFERAAGYWASALRDHPRAWRLHEDRARAFYQLGRMDSARTALQSTIDQSRIADTSEVRFLYESKAQWQYSLGRVYEREQNWNEARNMYQAALVEDLGYYPAHIRLAYIAFRAADTATALREFSRAAAIADGEYIPHLAYGEALLNARQLDSSVTHLRAAIAIEPHAATPHRLLARALEEKGDAAGAREEYRRYLQMARRDDANVSRARERLAALGG